MICVNGILSRKGWASGRRKNRKYEEENMKREHEENQENSTHIE